MRLNCSMMLGFGRMSKYKRISHHRRRHRHRHQYHHSHVTHTYDKADTIRSPFTHTHTHIWNAYEYIQHAHLPHFSYPHIMRTFMHIHVSYVHTHTHTHINRWAHLYIHNTRIHSHILQISVNAFTQPDFFSNENIEEKKNLSTLLTAQQQRDNFGIIE